MIMPPEKRVYCETYTNDDGTEDFTATFTDIPVEDVIGNEINKLRLQIRESVSCVVFAMYGIATAYVVLFGIVMIQLFSK